MRRSATAARRGLDVSITDGRGRALTVPGLARWLASVAPRRAHGEVGVAIVSDGRMRALNRAYRGMDSVTDVLSFPHDSPSREPVPADGFLGDIVIARGQAARQAASLGHSVSVELRVLVLHGLLHLLGHDHERDEGQMARLETRLRRKGGLPTGLIERERGR